MATFAKKDTNSTDIDPETLTVNLLGPDPDPDDLVIKPHNTEVSDIDSVTDNPADNESIDKILKAQHSASDNSASDEDHVEDAKKSLAGRVSLLSKRKTKAEENRNGAASTVTRKADPIVIVSSVVAAALLFVFAAYFLGFFDNSSLRMKLSEFSGSYAATDSYKAIAGYGFAFPEVTFDEESIATDAAGAAKASDESTFTAYVDNSVNYKLAISGSVNRTTENLRGLQIILFLNNNNSFFDVLIVLAPYLQVLYPDMSTQEATSLLYDLYISTDPVKLKGNYGLSVDSGSTGGEFFWILNLMSPKDARLMSEKIKAQDSSNAAATSSVAGASAGSE